MDKFRLTYNPYFQTLHVDYITPEGGVEKLTDHADDMVEKFKTEFVLQNMCHELLSAISEIGGSDTSLSFCGMVDDFNFLYRSIKQYNESHSCQFELERDVSIEIQSPESINKKITTIVDNLKKNGYSIDEEDSRKLDEILNPEIPIVVTGNYSSGKSMLINALVGAFILPSEQERTTATICEVKNSDESIVSFIINDDQKVTINCDIPQNSNIPVDNVMLNSLLNDINSIEDKYQRLKTVIEKINNQIEMLDILNKKISIQVHFQNSILDKNFVFIDIPGNDSESHQEQDAELINTALETLLKGFVIYVVKPDCMDSTGAMEYIKYITKKADGKLDIANTLIVCNKCENRADIPNNSSLSDWKANRLVVASAVMGLGSKVFDTSCLGEREEIYDNFKDKFSDIRQKYYLSLPEYAILPEERKKEVLRKRDNLLSQKKDDINVIKELIRLNSGIRTIENELNYLGKYLFPINQCSRAQKVLDSLLDKLEKKIESQKQKAEETQKRQSKEFEKYYKTFKEKIIEIGNTKKEKIENSFPDDLYKNKYQKKEQTSEFLRKAKEIVKSTINSNDDDPTEKKANEILRRKKSLEEALNNNLKSINDNVAFFSSEWGNVLLNEYKDDCLKITEKQNFPPEDQKVFEDYFCTDFNIILKESFSLSEFTIDPKVVVNNIVDFVRSIPNFFTRIVQESVYEKEIKNQYMFFYYSCFVKCQEYCKSQLIEIFNKIENSFDNMPNNKGLCQIHPKLNDLASKLDIIENEIEWLLFAQFDIERMKKTIDEIQTAIRN